MIIGQSDVAFFHFPLLSSLVDNAALNVSGASAFDSDTAVTDVTAAVDVPWVSAVSYSLLLLRQLLLTYLKLFAGASLGCGPSPTAVDSLESLL